MKLFTCQSCGQMLYFENEYCERCGHRLGYLPDIGDISAVTPDGDRWEALANSGQRYRFCANWEVSACNWMVPADGEEAFCMACRHNRTVPDISDPVHHGQWRRIEEAKRRLFYTLIKLELPIPDAASGAPEPLIFDILADLDDGSPKVMTGHDEGLITIALREADDAWREKLRSGMGEPYRTLLGHFRHEVGHYYWDILVRDGGHLEGFRQLFGDETADYGEALQRHYQQGAPEDWRDTYVSAYATMHPWEDWAESWAHYLHIVDTLDMASAFGISISPGASEALSADVDFDPHQVKDVATLIDAWLPLTYAVNSLNRAMGQPDLYPFVLPPAALVKLGYIHDLIREQRRAR